MDLGTINKCIALAEEHIIADSSTAGELNERAHLIREARAAVEVVVRLRAANARLREAVEQALDDMGEDGLSVCPAAKAQLRAALETPHA